ncbi:hypothetical protein CAC42_2926 [Sphaceloma murrayae]|uniref:Rab-GAP TBC domain-containing protein n=1 Tax=Sphaceloma murrayae TaxID=2082308 RepID=A0A2K1R055_9PEZI|nr:hypothetical protein CAC42_2926 [Sphaceloma murrayae]
MDVATTTHETTSSLERPPTPYDFNLLKSLRTQAASETPTPSQSSQQQQSTPTKASTKTADSTPHTSPQVGGSPSNQHSDGSAKRDSAIVRSNSTARFESYAGARNSGVPAPVPELPRQPSRGTLSSIRKSPSLRRLSGAPAQNRLRKKSLPEQVRQALENSPPPPPTPPIPHHVRIKSFHGISLDIPTGELEGLHDAEHLEFSTRGSMLLGDKMMAVMGNEAPGDGREQKGALTQEGKDDTRDEQHTHAPDPHREGLGEDQSAASTERTSDAVGPPASQDAEPKDSTQEATSPKGLKSGRRKPSIHMLEAAINGGRVLSAEEISFSIRLRSMYEAGDEKAADWSTPAVPETIRSVSPEPDASLARAETPESEPTSSSLAVPKRRTAPNKTQLRPSTSTARMASIPRTSTEVAGGMEDFEDISARDVDRYGFIVPSLSVSRTSDGTRPSMDPSGRPSTSSGPSRPAIQRVSTSLQLISDTPRRKRTLRRGPSTATKRSSRSVPPTPRDARSLRTQSSVYSFRSTSTGLFEVKGRYGRLMDQASDMLTLPPGLEAIAEQEDGGRTGEKMRRREWGREEKWRRMAIKRDAAPSDATNGKTVGAGMAFTFDTSDPRLANRTWKGIPDRWRATAWHAFLAESRRRRGGESDEELVDQFHRLQAMNCADDVQIDVDVPRSIGMHVMFRKRYRGGQRLLFRVLHAIALKFPDTGYVQGMASLATTLLCYFDEEMAFVMLVRMWELRGLKTFFSHGFEGLMAALEEFEKEWLGKGDVAAKLEELGIGGTAYGTRWYLTLFNMSIPFAAQLRVWDVFMLMGDGEGQGSFEGADLDVLHATSAAMIDATRDILLDSDFENAMKVLTSWIPVKDEDLLMRVAKAEWKAKKRRVKKS